MLAPKAQEHKFWPEKVFSTNNPPPPHLSSQNDQRDVGIILSHRCWVDPPPPRHGRSGTPALNPPSRHGGQGGGGVGKMGFRVTPPPRAIFFPPWNAVSPRRGHALCARARPRRFSLGQKSQQLLQAMGAPTRWGGFCRTVNNCLQNSR